MEAIGLLKVLEFRSYAVRYNHAPDKEEKTAQFEQTISKFHTQASNYMNFNDSNISIHDVPSYFCNICQINYPNDYTSLDNHMFDIHQIDIRASTSKKHKRYINWMEHAALNVFEINSSINEYATFDAQLKHDSDNIISVCADTGSATTFMNEDLLPKSRVGV